MTPRSMLSIHVGISLSFAELKESITSQRVPRECRFSWQLLSCLQGLSYRAVVNHDQPRISISEGKTLPGKLWRPWPGFY